jgi:hypothetical protein
MPIDKPVTMAGAAPGRITSLNNAPPRVPSERAVATSRGSTPSTPWIVLSRIGNSAPMNVMNIMLISDEGNIRMASGIHATAGIGRKTSSGGRTASSNAR